ncbi:DUF2515 family protein [Pseudomonas sp. FEN]|uniref:DUF2515 family protein n=1 Tax=Pseudomonas sp. FEN TaxID=2767468 RepID=UPI001CD1B721|nr:hypothetical protein [Pseudomonas sp. FEN]
MSADPILTCTTNTRPGSLSKQTFGCEILWAWGQQEAIRRLTVEKRDPYSQQVRNELVASFSARAARIAATYARFYLELEDGGKPELKGRFYWMGLAAFASKQVKCGLDFIPDALAVSVGDYLPNPMAIGKDGLGKGNFWLFQDIFVWHWFYSQFPEQFEECALERNALNCPELTLAGLKSLPWAEEALATLNNFKVNPHILEAFETIKKCEQAATDNKPDLQFDSLLAIANHEQLEILQPLIYENQIFQKVLDLQALTEGLPGFPLRVAAFSTACDVEEENLREQMTEGDLYNETHRMKFITKIANKYHSLMQYDTEYMEERITSISNWSNAA